MVKRYPDVAIERIVVEALTKRRMLTCPADCNDIPSLRSKHQTPVATKTYVDYPALADTRVAASGNRSNGSTH
jgi:hypothetical protein